MIKTRSKHFKGIFLGLFFIVLYVPIVSVIIYSFNKSPSTAQWTGFALDWYKSLFQDKVIIEAFWLSLQVGVMTAVLSAFIGTFAAITSTFVDRKVKRSIDASMVVPLLVPEVALGVSLLIMYNILNIPLGRFTLVLSHSLFCIPYVYVMVQLRLNEISHSVLEASRDLGATQWEMVKTIIIPLVIPSIVTSSLLALAMSLDDVVISTYVSGTKSTLPVHIFSMMRTGVTPKINALSTIILLFTFIILGLSQIDFKKKKEGLDYEK